MCYMYSTDKGEHVPIKAYTTMDGIVLCKNCNFDNEQISPAIVVDNIVGKLKIKCVNSGYNDNNEGIAFTKSSNKCTWKGLVSELNYHINNECEYKVTLCEYCKIYKGIKNEMVQHHSNCGKYILDCELKCDNQILRENMKYHIKNECINTMLLCSNNGCDTQIKRKDYENHVNNECQYISILCPFNKYGCNIDSLNKLNLNDHLNNNKMMHYLFKIDYDNNNIKKELNNLKDMIGNGVLQTSSHNDTNSDTKDDINDDNVVLKQPITNNDTQYANELNALKQKIYELENKPIKPKVSLRDIESTHDSVTLLFDNSMNSGKNIIEYELKYTRILPTIYYNINDKDYEVHILNELYNSDDEKIEWKNSTLKYDQNKRIQKCIINDIDCINSKYFFTIHSKTEHFISPPTYIITDYLPQSTYESSILTGHEKSKLLHIISKQLSKSIQLKRIYSGKHNGFTRSKFHNKCDNKGETIILIENDYNTIFGGYTSKSWNEDGLHDSDKNAFLFQIKPNINIFKQRSNAGSHAIYHNFAFGETDLVINDNCNENKNSYSRPYTYVFTKGKDLVGGISNDKQINFKVSNMEVFLVE